MLVVVSFVRVWGGHAVEMLRSHVRGERNIEFAFSAAATVIGDGDWEVAEFAAR